VDKSSYTEQLVATVANGDNRRTRRNGPSCASWSCVHIARIASMQALIEMFTSDHDQVVLGGELAA
jgi:hypothetical protein